MSEAGDRQPIWDVPIRLFHWTLAALIGFSWWSAQSGHLDWHLYSGLFILSLLFFRILWGLVGSSTARFANFVRGPGAVRAYLTEPAGWRSAGHTPLGALSVLAMMGAIAVQVMLGLFATDEDGLFEGPLAHFLSIDNSDVAREIHQLWFWVVVGLIALHVAAIIYYRVRGTRLAAAMITGKGFAPQGAPPLKRGKWWVALLCLAAGVAITRAIIALGG